MLSMFVFFDDAGAGGGGEEDGCEDSSLVGGVSEAAVWRNVRNDDVCRCSTTRLDSSLPQYRL